jgi:hypothetical protein
MNLALGREHIDGIREKIDLDVVPKLGGVPRFVLDVQQGLQPLGTQTFTGGVVGMVDLVEPVGGNARLCNNMHGLGPHLEFDVDSRGAYQCGVQGLVAIEFGNCNMVLELAGNRLVQLVQQTQRGVAVNDRGHQHPEPIDVGHLGKAQVLVGHFLVNRIERFFPSGDAHGNVGLGKNRLDFLLHFLNQVAPAATSLGHGLFQNVVAPGLEVLERQVLQLTVGLVQTQAVRNRRVDFKSLGRDAVPFGTGYVGQRAHIVRTVGQFDQDDANIARHGQQHLAEGLGLVLFAGVELQLVELGQAIDQFRYRRPEAFNQFDFGNAAVFQRIMQERCHEGLRIKLPLGALCRDRNGVRDVGLTVVAQLAQVRFIRKTVGQANLLDILRREIVQLRRQAGKAGRRCVRGGIYRLDWKCATHAVNVAPARQTRVASGQKKAPRTVLFGSESGSERHFFQHFNADFARSNFAQGSDAGLVLAFDLGRVSLAQHASAVRSRQHQLKAIGDFFEAVFDSDTGHGVSPKG